MKSKLQLSQGARNLSLDFCWKKVRRGETGKRLALLALLPKIVELGVCDDLLLDLIYLLWQRGEVSAAINKCDEVGAFELLHHQHMTATAIANLCIPLLYSREEAIAQRRQVDTFPRTAASNALNF